MLILEELGLMAVVMRTLGGVGGLAGLRTILHYILDPEAATHTYNPNVQEIGGRKIRPG